MMKKTKSIPDSFHDSNLLNQTANYLFSHQYPPITFGEIFLTDHCNLACDYCFVKRRSNRVMDLDTIRQSVDFLLLYSRDAPVLKIFFFGGEPFLYFDLIRETVSYTEAKNRKQRQSKKIYFELTTNGTLLTDEIIRYCKENNFFVLLSIDGLKEDHDKHRKKTDGSSSFDSIINILPIIMKNNLSFQVKITFVPDTLSHLTENVKALHTLGITDFLFSPASFVPWQPKAIKEYEKQMIKLGEYYIENKLKNRDLRMNEIEAPLKEGINHNRGEWGCSGCRDRICVDIDGTIYPCGKFLSYVPPLPQKQVTFPIGDVWNGITKPRRRDVFLLNIDKNRPLECHGCETENYCRGGCMVENLYSTGSLYKRSEQSCEIQKAQYRSLKHIIQKAGDAGF